LDAAPPRGFSVVVIRYGRFRRVAKKKWLKTIVPLPYGIPSHDTFSTVFRHLDPDAFDAAFRRLTASFAQGLEGVVAIDGKAVRGAYRRAAKATPLHFVNVWAAGPGLVIGQKLAPGAAMRCKGLSMRSRCWHWRALSSPPMPCIAGPTPPAPSSLPAAIMLWH
jgi:hypothetical protein